MMNQRERDQKKKARKIQSRKRVLARREDIRNKRKEEDRLEKEFEDRESKYMSKEEIVERLQHNMKLLEKLELDMKAAQGDNKPVQGESPDDSQKDTKLV